MGPNLLHWILPLDPFINRSVGDGHTRVLPVCLDVSEWERVSQGGDVSERERVSQGEDVSEREGVRRM